MAQRIRPGTSSTTATAQRVGEDESAGGRLAPRWRLGQFGFPIALVVGLLFNYTSLQSKQDSITETEQNQRPPKAESLSRLEDDFTILVASIPRTRISRLHQDTQHSHTSPLAPQFQPRQISNYSNLRPYIGCKATEKVKIVKTPEDRWQLETFLGDNTLKSVGGDEYYVTFTRYSDVNLTVMEDPVFHHTTQHPTLVAIVTDLQNGKYSLEFLRPPSVVHAWETTMLLQQQPQDGYLTVYLTFTCGMGLVTQKSDWHSRGSLDWAHVQHNTPMPPSWKEFKVPRIAKRLSHYDYVAAFGDSVLGLFVGQYRDNIKFRKYPIPEGFPPPDKVHFKGNIRKPFLNNTGELKKTFHNWHGNRILSRQQKEKGYSAAILLGSGTWDLGSFTWNGGDETFALEPTLQAYYEFFAWLLDTYQGVDIYWKSLSATHPHNVMDLRTIKPDNLDRVKMGTMYVSAARAKALDCALRDLIRARFKSRIRILDVYRATELSAEWLFPDDSHHYRWEMNWHMLIEWFY